MYELLQAFDVAVMKELFLEVRFPGAGFGGGTLRRCRRHIASRGHLELAVNHWCKLYPRPVWVGAGAETTSEESSHSQISVAEAERIPNEPKGIRRGLIIESIPGVQRQTLIGRAETGEQRRVRRRGCAGVHLTWIQSRPSSVDVARVAIPFAVEQLEPGHLVCSHRVVVLQERVEFRREIADLHGLLVCVNRRTPVVIDRLCLCALFRSQLDWFGVSTEHGSSPWGCTDLLSVMRELDIERVFAPHQFEERFVHSLRKPKRDASSVREAHFLSIDGRTLCLFGVGIP